MDAEVFYHVNTFAIKLVMVFPLIHYNAHIVMYNILLLNLKYTVYLAN